MEERSIVNKMKEKTKYWRKKQKGPKSWAFEKVDKTDKLRARLIEGKERRHKLPVLGMRVGTSPQIL